MCSPRRSVHAPFVAVLFAICIVTQQGLPGVSVSKPLETSLTAGLCIGSGNVMLVVHNDGAPIMPVMEV